MGLRWNDSDNQNLSSQRKLCSKVTLSSENLTFPYSHFLDNPDGKGQKHDEWQRHRHSVSAAAKDFIFLQSTCTGCFPTDRLIQDVMLALLSSTELSMIGVMPFHFLMFLGGSNIICEVASTQLSQNFPSSVFRSCQY
jgi:hypothetical protein